MHTLTLRNQILVGATLAALLVVTRNYHFSSIHSLPSSSWAVFMLAGFYLRPSWVLIALLAIAASQDIIAVTWGGVSNFCMNPAYWMLAPAYGSLWLAGRWYGKHYRFAPSTLLPLLSAVLLGSFVCELFSSGGFYVFSGRFEDPNMLEFTLRFLKYFPSYLESVMFYIGIAAIVHSTFVMLDRKSRAASIA